MRRPTLVWLSPVILAMSACASVVAFDPAGLVDSGLRPPPAVGGQGGDSFTGAGGDVLDSNGGVPPSMGSGGATPSAGGTPTGPGGSTGTGGRSGTGEATGSGGQFIQPIGQGGSGGRRTGGSGSGSCSPTSCPACNVAQGPACCTPAGKCGCPLFWIPGTCG
jgi:hypothetical protein